MTTPPRPKRTAILGLFIVLATSTIACGEDMTNNDANPRAVNLTIDEVLTTSREQLRESLGLWGQNATAREVDSPLSQWCSDESTPPEGTPIRIQTLATVTGVDEAPEQMLRSFQEHWEGKNWKVNYKNDDGVSLSSPDGFTLKLTTDARVVIGTESPCIPGKVGALPPEYDELGPQTP